MDVRKFNERAWDRQVAAGNRWTVPVGPEVIAAARAGEWGVVLTPVQIVRNVIGMLKGPDPAQPSAELTMAVRMQIAGQAIAARLPKAA